MRFARPVKAPEFAVVDVVDVNGFTQLEGQHE